MSWYSAWQQFWAGDWFGPTEQAGGTLAGQATARFTTAGALDVTPQVKELAASALVQFTASGTLDTVAPDTYAWDTSQGRAGRGHTFTPPQRDDEDLLDILELACAAGDDLWH